MMKFRITQKIINMKYLALFIMSMLFTQCWVFLDDDSLSLPLTPYHGNQLRIDGYYYRIADGTDFAVGTIVSCYFFYENGIILYRGSSGSSIEDMDSSIINNQNYKNIKFSWGVFVIEGNTIKFDRWYPGAKPYRSYVREGVILNDTTFHITKSYRSNGTEQREKDEVYHFREFLPKPDSTNVYIK